MSTKHPTPAPGPLSSEPLRPKDPGELRDGHPLTAAATADEAAAVFFGHPRT